MNILLISLGCDKNLCDSEAMLGLIKEHGYNITNDENEADAVVINTCSFIQDAMQESIDTILEMAELKKERLKYIIVCGCLAERFKDEIFSELPEIDAVVGTTAFDRIISVIEELEARTDTDKRVLCYEDVNRLAICASKRVVTTGTHMAYLKIAEGCDKYCTYCIIPHLRGRYRSVPMEKLVDEARELAAQGIKELVLVAQETTCYGVDLYGKKALHELIHELALIEGIEWIRLLYCYPEEIYDGLIDAFCNEPKLCNYIDMPIQHSEDGILKRMGRRTDRQSIIDTIAALRERVPDITLRTTFITGFPGETEEEHKGVLEFIDEIEFDRVGVFTYSREEGTPAAAFSDQVDEELAARWRDEIMELQQEISLCMNSEFIDTRLRVVIEGYSPDEDVYVARSYRDAPGVDGLIFVECDYELMSGTFCDVLIKEVGPYDMIGVICDEFAE